MILLNVPNAGDMENNIDVIFDTNALIYIVAGKEKYVHLLDTLGFAGISILSSMELSIGAKTVEEESSITSLLLDIEIIPLTQEIGLAAVASLRKRGKNSIRVPQLADTIIAHTALSLGVPLVTNNPKDFEAFEGLKLIVP